MSPEDVIRQLLSGREAGPEEFHTNNEFGGVLGESRTREILEHYTPAIPTRPTIQQPDPTPQQPPTSE